jgi:MtN3 and saliva related transmembrane protein
MEWIQAIGTVGALASVASFTPQAWRIIRARSTEGLSAGMYALTVLAFACWSTFGVLKGEWTLIVPNIICLLFAVFILGMIILPQHRTEKVAERLDPTTPT